jgi:hypothetical protein
MIDVAGITVEYRPSLAAAVRPVARAGLSPEPPAQLEPGTAPMTLAASHATAPASSAGRA